MAEWISVNDRLPKNNLVRVLVFLKDDEFTKPIGFNKIDTDRCIDGKWVRWGEHVTHWKMLPAPPNLIDKTSTADVVEVKYGEWDDSGRYKFADGSLAIRCTVCGCAIHSDEYGKYHWNYCPVCGAKMDGGEEK